jgi:hypothetical protein
MKDDWQATVLLGQPGTRENENGNLNKHVPEELSTDPRSDASSVRWVIASEPPGLLHRCGRK